MEITTETKPASPASTTSETSARTRWVGLLAVLTALLMNILDSTIVNVAAPAIRADLGSSYTQIQWTAAVYTLALAVGLLTGGRLGDMFGRRRLMLLGAGAFVLASMACAAAWSPESLIAARLLQGLAGSVMVPQAFGLIRDLFPPAEVGKAWGAMGPTIGLSTVLGPVVAGLLVDGDLFGTGWRSVFLINLPLGLFTIIAGRATLPKVRPHLAGERRIDLLGVVLAGAGTLMLVYPLVQGQELGWPTWTFLMLAAGVVALTAFVLQQRRRAASGRIPLAELGVLARRSYASGVVFVIVFFGGIVGFSLVVGLFLQIGLGQSPVKASLTMSGWAVGAFLGSGFAAAMMTRLERRILHLGLAIMAVGLVSTWAVFAVSGTAVGSSGLLLPLFVYGAGMGMIFVPLFDIIMGEVEDHEVGSAAGLLESLQQLGASLGVAVLGTIFFAGISPVPSPEAFVGAVEEVTLICVVLVGLAFGIGFLLPRKARPHVA